jgi:hypothetical protein
MRACRIKKRGNPVEAGLQVGQNSVRLRDARACRPVLAAGAKKSCKVGGAPVAVAHERLLGRRRYIEQE